MKLFEVDFDRTVKGKYAQYIIVGVFSSKKKAKKAVRQLRKKKKFAEHKDCFYIHKITVDPFIIPWDMSFFSY